MPDNQVIPQILNNGTEEDEINITPVLDYLGSERGHELASRVVKIFEGIQQTTLATSSKHAIFEMWFKSAIVALVVIAASLLTYAGKFDSSVGVLFGTLVGYVFGKKS